MENTEDDLWCNYSDLPSVMSYEEPKKIYLSNMKYLITESQFDKIIFKYLDSQKFIKIEKQNRIYFVNSEGDKYAQIRFDKKNGFCYIYYKLIDEISTFFSMENSDSKQVIGRWVENTLQMRATNTDEGLLNQIKVVENTLQMRATNTQNNYKQEFLALKIPYKK